MSVRVRSTVSNVTIVTTPIILLPFLTTPIILLPLIAPPLLYCYRLTNPIQYTAVAAFSQAKLWDSDAPVDLTAFEELGRAGSARRKVVRLLKEGVLMDVEKLVKLCKDNVGDVTFAEAYQKTGRIINITLPHKSQNRGGSQLLNYLTAPHVLLWSAACASCAQAGLYKSVELLIKNEKNELQPMYASGRVDHLTRHDDLPMHRAFRTVQR